MSAPEPSRRVTAVILLLVVLVGGFLRCWNLDWDRGGHLHPDERYLAIVNSKTSAPDGVAGWFDTDGSPLNPQNRGEDYVYGTAPLFLTKGVATWLHHGASTGAEPAHTVVAGLDRLGVPLLDDGGTPRFDGGYGSELVGRLLSALIDTATIGLVFLLGRAIGGRRAGLASALVWATCALAIQHAHFFVVEPMLVFATALALLAAVHVSRGGGRWLMALGGAAGGLAGASKVNGLAVLAVVGAAAAVDRWPVIRSAWGAAEGRVRRLARASLPLAVDAGVVAAAAFVVLRTLQPYMFRGLVGLDPRWRQTMAQLQDLQANVDVPSSVQWADRVPVLEPLGHLVMFGFGLPATALVLVALVRLRRRAAWAGEPGLVLLLGWVALVGAIFLPRFVSSMRYLLPAYPALAVLAGLGLSRLAGADRRVWRVAGGLALVLAVLWGFAFTNGVYGRPHTRVAASAWLVDHAPDGAVLSVQHWDDGLPILSEAALAKGFVYETLEPFAVQTPDDVRRLAASLARIDYVVESSDRVTASVTRIPGRYGPVLRYHRALADGTLGFEPVASFVAEPSLLGFSLSDAGSEEAFRVYDHPPVRIWRKTEAFSLERTLTILQPDRASTSERVPLQQGGSNGLLERRDADDPGTGPTFDQVFPDRLPVPWLWWWLWFQVVAWAALPWVTRLFAAMPDRGFGVAKVIGPMAVVIPLWSMVAWGVVSFSMASVWAVTAAVVAVGWAVPRWRRDLLDLLRRERSWVGVELVVLAVFAAVALLRAANPDLWFHPTGGEKPFASAYFTAVARSSSFPPSDPWFSGGSMNYYYVGWFAQAVPSRALGIRPEVALNLALPTVAAMLAGVAWSLGAGLGALRDRTRTGGRAAVGVGLLAVVGLLLSGNLAAARQQQARVRDALGGRVAPAFDWWSTSRVNPPTSDINEFPAWTLLFGDPHPHLLALPVLLALVAVLVAYVAARRHGTPGSALGLSGLAGVGLAWTRIGHTWDLPAALLLTVVAVAVGSALDQTPGRRRWQQGAGHLAVMAVLTLLVGHPYVAATQVFDSGFTSSPARTPLPSFLLQFGVPLAVSAVALAVRWRAAVRGGTLPGPLRDQRGRRGGWAAAAGMGVLVGVAAGSVVALAGVVVVGGLLAAVADLRAGALGRGLSFGIVAAGCGLAAVPELLVVVNDISRMNTVFKFGYSAWALLAVGSAVLLADLVGSSVRHRGGARVAAVLVMVPGLLFWPSAVGPALEARFADLPLTLDGRAWLRHGPVVVETHAVPPIDVTADEPLIAWVRANVRGGDTLVEAAAPAYTWAGRVSVATGVPTVIGWPVHQSQQRRGYAASVDARLAAVTRFYTDPEPEVAWRFLAAYRPDHVVVGTVERVLGTDVALAGLADLEGLTLAWSAGDALVYTVDHGAIDRRLAAIDAERLAGAEVDRLAGS